MKSLEVDFVRVDILSGALLDTNVCNPFIEGEEKPKATVGSTLATIIEISFILLFLF